MNILVVEPFYISSHKSWADGLKRYSRNSIDLITLPGRHWKWRMHGGAVTLSRQLNDSTKPYDLILCTDMIDVGVFKSLLPKQFEKTKLAVYFHENQLTYPWSATDPDIALQRDNHYGWINYTSALTADQVIFNSQYHKDVFVNALPKFLNQFPDETHPETILTIEEKANVLSIGINDIGENTTPYNSIPTILWNHRWEYDKNPEAFFKAIFKLDAEGYDFRLNIVGEQYRNKPSVFEQARIRLSDKIINWGFVKSDVYKRILLSSDIVPITSNQDFFGISAVEAMNAGCVPIFPNRLAFPEHLKNKKYSHLYYDNFDQLVKSLKTVITNISSYEKAEIRKETLKYCWPNVINQYDTYFEGVVSPFKMD